MKTFRGDLQDSSSFDQFSSAMGRPFLRGERPNLLRRRKSIHSIVQVCILSQTQLTTPSRVLDSIELCQVFHDETKQEEKILRQVSSLE